MARSLDKPNLVLRVGVAGAITVTEDQRARLHARLMDVYGVLAHQLRALSPAAVPHLAAPDICSYYAGAPPTSVAEPDREDCPVLRLVSGLADGSDQIAFESLIEFEKSARMGTGAAGQYTRFELVAILPSDLTSFRDNSAVVNKEAFNALVDRCTVVIELDGNCAARPPEPAPPDPLTSERRNRAFRLQATMLLRQCDLLIAVADPNAKGGGGIGGTRETMTRAVELGIPVVLLSGAPPDGDYRVSLALARSDLESAPGCSVAKVGDGLETIVSRILADPRTARRDTFAQSGDTAEPLAPNARQLLDELFDDVDRVARVRPRLWSWFEKRFKRLAATARDAPIEPFDAYCTRAGDLSAYYTGLYRGAFLLNYSLAVVAVMLAASTLVYLIALARGGGGSSAPASLVLLLISLAELSVLVVIFLNTHQGNRNRWNGKAIDYRYLAERLRTLYYLARLGCLRASPPRAAQYAAAALRQSVIDWLLQAIIRQSPPDTGLRTGHPPDGWKPARGGNGEPRFARSDVRQAAAAMNDHWLRTQIEYHRATGDTQLRMHRWIEAWVWRLNVSVIVIVVIDLLIVIAGALGAERAWERAAHDYSPLLIFFAAVLPAVVASLNSIRFQSECLRIAERSAVMVTILEDRRARCGRLERALDAAPNDPSDRGGWTLEALELAESCSQIVTDEVAEWSVLYSRDLLEA